MRWWQLPAISLLFAILSLFSLNSLAPDLAWRQLFFWLIGSLIFSATSLIRIERWQKIVWPIYIFLVVTLILLLFLPPIRGSHRWLIINTWQVQPSQFILPVMALLMSKLKPISGWKSVASAWRALIILIMPLFFVLAEPDLGTSLILLASLAVSWWILGANYKLFVQGLTLFVLAAGLGWLTLLQPYQKQRVTSFLEPDLSSPAATYNTKQAMISVGSGGWLGRGLGLGTQSQLHFLPESETDFIFAALAEETGFLGTIFLLFLYLYLLYRLVRALPQLPEKNQPLIALAISWLALQTSVHIGINLGILPVTGLTLPLISYGGSSLISTLWWFGLIQSQILHINTSSHIHLG